MLAVASWGFWYCVRFVIAVVWVLRSRVFGVLLCVIDFLAVICLSCLLLVGSLCMLFDYYFLIFHFVYVCYWVLVILVPVSVGVGWMFAC